MNKDLITILIISLATIFTRVIPFILFPKNKPTPLWIVYLGKVLPFSVMAMLIVYCLKETNFVVSNHGIPEIIAVALTIALHLWKENTLLSIFCGTATYMLLVQCIYI